MMKSGWNFMMKWMLLSETNQYNLGSMKKKKKHRFSNNY